MSKNPYLNAGLATLYIVTLVSAISFASQFTKDTPDTILAPIAMLSLFVLSAATMGYLFVLQPAMLYLDGKKQEAITFFLKTMFTFAGITVVFLVLAFTASRLM